MLQIFLFKQIPSPFHHSWANQFNAHNFTSNHELSKHLILFLCNEAYNWVIRQTFWCFSQGFAPTVVTFTETRERVHDSWFKPGKVKTYLEEDNYPPVYWPTQEQELFMDKVLTRLKDKSAWLFPCMLQIKSSIRSRYPFGSDQNKAAIALHF